MATHRQTRKGSEFYSEYQRWKAMKRRCFYQKDKHFKDYGARGITVCDRWMSFENFIFDMGKCPDDHSLERINNDGNYEPSNCRWANSSEQAKNKRNVVLIEFNSQLLPASKVAQLNGIKRSTYSMRIQYGWTHIDAATRRK